VTLSHFTATVLESVNYKTVMFSRCPARSNVNVKFIRLSDVLFEVKCLTS
jgi:hypothetical protein